jgi:hypothetical protein
VVSPDIAAKYDCLPSEPPPGLTLAEVVTAVFPDDCPYAQKYFSIELADDAAGVEAAIDEFTRRAEERTASVLAGITDLDQFPGQGPQYSVIPTITAADVDRVEDAVRPTETALLVLAGVMALMSVTLTGLFAWRELRRTAGEQAQWHQLGATRTARMFVAGLPLASAALVGAALSVPLAWLFDVGPQGLAATIEPDPARRLLARSLMTLAVVTLVMFVAIVALAWSASRAAEGRRTSSAPAATVVPIRWASPAVGEGVRSALGRRSKVPVVAGVAVAVAAFVAALTFGAGLHRLVSTPASFGWPWDVAGAVNAGYGPLDIERATQTLDSDPDVEAWTYYGFVSGVSLDGVPVPALIDPGAGSRAGITVVEGELPSRLDEVAVGVTTADELGLEVGDAVEVGSIIDPARTATVTAITVMPTFGPFGSERVNAGVGMLAPYTMFEAAGLGWVSAFYGFVGVDVADGPQRAASIERLAEELIWFGVDGVRGNAYVEPVRPVEIVDAEGTQAMPRAFGFGFAAVAVIGLALAAWAAVRGRRRELAVLRALGFDASQVRHTVWVESVVTALASLAVGVPAGVIVGRTLWRSFADQIGLVPDPVTPWTALVAIVAGGLAVAWLVALIPARSAGRTPPTIGLRAE